MENLIGVFYRVPHKRWAQRLMLRADIKACSWVTNAGEDFEVIVDFEQTTFVIAHENKTFTDHYWGVQAWRI